MNQNIVPSRFDRTSFAPIICHMKLLRVGFGNAVVADRVRQIVDLKTPGGRRWRQEADKIGKLIDATAGRHTRAVVITDSGHIVLSSLSADILKERWKSD
jgi:regulator of extracellular matrix RemA (YlzA/DUF370 family)